MITQQKSVISLCRAGQILAFLEWFKWVKSYLIPYKLTNAVAGKENEKSICGSLSSDCITGGKISAWLQWLLTSRAFLSLLDYRYLHKRNPDKLVSKCHTNNAWDTVDPGAEPSPTQKGLCGPPGSPLTRSPGHGSSTSTLALINLLQGHVLSTCTGVTQSQSLRATLLCSQQLNQHITHWNCLTFHSNDLWPLDTHIPGFAPSGLWPQSQRVAFRQIRSRSEGLERCLSLSGRGKSGPTRPG